MRLHHTQEQIDAYLDEEMPGNEREAFVAHDGECKTCYARVESRRNLLHAVRAARPEFQASADLRRSVAAALARGESPEPGRSWFLNWKSFFSLSNWLPDLRLTLRYAWVLPILVGIVFTLYLSQRQARATRLVDTAVDIHQHRLAGGVPVEFESDSARDVTSWCNARLSFAFRLPTYQDDSGDRSKYQLLGASIIKFRGRNAAYIAYRMKEERLSLIVVSDEQAIASGGEVIKAKSLSFHTVRKDGLEVLTWSVRHLTYALVSDVDLPPKKSCVVCHADPKDHHWLQSALTHRVLLADRNCVFEAGGLPAIKPLH